MNTLKVEELRFLVKSLSRSYDSLATKIARMGNRSRDEDRAEFQVCEDLLNRARRELTAKLQQR